MKKNTYLSISEEALRNGSFYRFTGRKLRDRFARYVNGDFMGFTSETPSAQPLKQWEPKVAKPMLPACFR